MYFDIIYFNNIRGSHAILLHDSSISDIMQSINNIKGDIMTTELERLEQQIINAKNKTQKSINALQNAKNIVKENQKKENELKRKIERLKTEKERKERTKRLIEIGAMIESIAGGELDLYKFQSYLNQYKLAISALKKQRRN